jgi:NAD(P)H-hydrate repair Nnr-like enzyme with NAD(P)H-hydrate epimerase domain
MPPIALYLTKQLKACIEKVTTTLPISKSVLVKRTGQAALKALQTIFPQTKTLAIYFISDKANLGYMHASPASKACYVVTINRYDVFNRFSNDASTTSKKDHRYLLKSTTDSNVNVIIDALVGVENACLSESISIAIKHINNSKIPVLSLTIPSGLNADIGQIKTIAIKALCPLVVEALALRLLASSPI